MKKLLPLLLAASFWLTTALAQSGPETYVYQTFTLYDTLDPITSYDTASWTIIENVYETLYTYDGDSVTEHVPLLATSYEESEDGLTYTYQLREGVQFHSGNTFSCKDVEYSFERALVINASDSGIWFLAESLLGTGQNADDFLAADEGETGGTGGEADAEAGYEEYWNNISASVECPDGPDGLSVVFTLPSVDPAFFTKLMAANMSIVDMQWAIDNGMWDGTGETWREWIGADVREYYLHENTSGTGAYQLVQATPETVVAEVFENYWGEAPAIQEVLIQSVEEEATRVLQLQQGDADRISVNSWATVTSQIEGLEGVTVHSSDDWNSLSIGALHLNQDVNTEDNQDVGSGQLDGSGIPSDFFADENVRKGFANSFDQQTFIDQVYQGRGQPLTMTLPPSFLGYNDEIEPYTYDPEVAEEAFRAAFDGELWDTGFELTIAYNTGNTVRQTIAQIMKDNIEALNPNFRINVRGIQWPDFLAARQARKLPVSIVSWVPDYADPDNYMYTFYHSDGYYGDQLGFSNDEINSLLEEARTATDQEQRGELYREVGALAHDLYPTVPYPTQQAFIVARDNVEGVYYNPMLSHQFRWKDISKQ